MFFLITNISIGRCYPNIWTQFVFGAVCYAISFFILKDFISAETYEKYKYYLGIIVIVDTSFLVYQYKYNSVGPNTKPEPTKAPTEDLTTENNSKTAPKSELDVSFTSDFDDYKVMHDLSASENDEQSTLPVSEEEPKSETKRETKIETSISFSMQT
jgi:hypothetical protein